MTFGELFVVSAPSGAGKTTVCRRVINELDRIGFSVSYTTRPPRPGEVDGKDYHFVDDREFLSMIEKDEFLEWAWVHKYRYGTSNSEIKKILGQGRDIILDIDVQGALNVKAKMPDANLIFILPPSMEELERRLRSRGSDNEEQISIRMKTAQDEIRHVFEYEYIIVNDELDRAVSGLESIITARRLRSNRVLSDTRLFSLLNLS